MVWVPFVDVLLWVKLFIIKQGKTVKLNQSTILDFASDVMLPAVTPKKSRMMHVGVGNFYRAHQAVYTEDAMSKSGDLNWGMIGVGILPSDEKMAAVMKEQDNLYTLVIKPMDSTGDAEIRIINVLTDYIHACEEYNKFFEQVLSDDLRIITLTITEGGYNINQRTGEFDRHHPLVQHDIDHPEQPKTIFGFLCRALELRRQQNKKGLTILSCDNIQHNGNVLKSMFSAYLKAANQSELEKWVNTHCSFPNCMVDRITPQTSDKDRAFLKDTINLDDMYPVVCEPFTQWVIEDKFVSGRPKWELAGAQFVKDVSPYEKMKLRLLNASHQALCYIGYLHGYRYVDQAAQDVCLNAFVRHYMKTEVVSTLDPVPGIDLDDYQDMVIKRFANPNIKDSLSRICEYTSDRIPVFNVPAMVEQIENVSKLGASALILASWLVYAQGVTESGEKIDIVDHRKHDIIRAAQAAVKQPEKFIEFRDLFGALCDSTEFKQLFSAAYFSIKEQGALGAVKAFLEHHRAK
jgi:mannitol 2-dehydrogenase